MKTYAPVAEVAWAGPNDRGQFWVHFKHNATDTGYGLKGPFTTQAAAERSCAALLEGSSEGRDPEEVS